ncbi:cobalamin biosynthesis protein CobD/CbiB [Bradyrhizobium sp. LB7.2]
MGFAGAMVVAMAVDALLGWPSWLFARIGHPVTWLGRLISAIDSAWNRASDPPALRRAAGVAGALVVIALAVALGWALQSLLPLGWIQVVLVGVLAWPLVALRSLLDHVLLPSQIPCGPVISPPHATRSRASLAAIP